MHVYLEGTYKSALHIHQMTENIPVCGVLQHDCIVFMMGTIVFATKVKRHSGGLRKRRLYSLFVSEHSSDANVDPANSIIITILY